MPSSFRFSTPAAVALLLGGCGLLLDLGPPDVDPSDAGVDVRSRPDVPTRRDADVGPADASRLDVPDDSSVSPCGFYDKSLSTPMAVTGADIAVNRAEVLVAFSHQGDVVYHRLDLLAPDSDDGQFLTVGASATAAAPQVAAAAEGFVIAAAAVGEDRFVLSRANPDSVPTRFGDVGLFALARVQVAGKLPLLTVSASSLSRLTFYDANTDPMVRINSTVLPTAQVTEAIAMFPTGAGFEILTVSTIGEPSGIRKPTVNRFAFDGDLWSSPMNTSFSGVLLGPFAIRRLSRPFDLWKLGDTVGYVTHSRGLDSEVSYSEQFFFQPEMLPASDRPCPGARPCAPTQPGQRAMASALASDGSETDFAVASLIEAAGATILVTRVTNGVEEAQLRIMDLMDPVTGEPVDLQTSTIAIARVETADGLFTHVLALSMPGSVRVLGVCLPL